MPKTILILGTLDTKGKEYEYLQEQIEKKGVRTLVVDISCREFKPEFHPDVSCDQVARAAGTSFKEISRGDRRAAMKIMVEGATKIVKKLHDEEKFQGIIAMGGSNATSMCCEVMRTLPISFPKVMVSTMASGNVRQYVGCKDIIMVNPVGDISLNRMTRRIFTNAANAIIGMVNAEAEEEENKKLQIAATMFGVTEPCLMKAKSLLEKEGYEVVVFHAVGTGGMAMEELIEQGEIDGVLDITTTELADELCGGVLSAGASRLEAAGKRGIPQVIVPGALDMVNFWAPETVPEKYRDRVFYRHNPQITLMRTTKEENKKLGRIIAEKVNNARGPTSIVLPLKGFSKYDQLNGVLAVDIKGKQIGRWYNPEADKAFIESLKKSVDPSKIEIVEINAHINDDVFAEQLARIFKKLWK